MYSMLRPWLFRMDAEKAHHLVLSALRLAPQICFSQPQLNKVQAMGLEFPHPIGLAAGLDKNGAYLDGLAKLGFSFIELGTVTPKGQIGNPKPRLFRVPEAQAVVNRMGFNNLGVEALVDNVKKARYRGVLGINIGKNKDTSLSRAATDYLLCLRAVYQYASYVTINISSPNTPELRELQRGLYFSALIAQLKEEQKKLQDMHQRHVPLVIKVSPDEDAETLKEMTESLLMYKVEGIIATNTTSAAQLFRHLPLVMRQGGLSGLPLQELSTACLRLLKKYVGNDITLIGVGGINDVASAQEKIDAGATLVQIYSGLVYQGPDLVPQLASGLALNKKEDEVAQDDLSE